MDPIRLGAELVFALVFLGTCWRYVKRRDPVSRDAALAFSALGLAFVVEVTSLVTGATPGWLRLVDGVLLLFQPVFVLHLVSLLRPVRRSVLVGSTLALVGSIGVAFAARGAPLAGLGVAAAFVGIEALDAGLLLVEARRRRGPGGARLAVAAGSTSLFAAALIVAGLAATGPSALTFINTTALALVLLAAFGYLVAFVPPRPPARGWSSPIGRRRRPRRAPDSCPSCRSAARRR